MPKRKSFKAPNTKPIQKDGQVSSFDVISQLSILKDLSSTLGIVIGLAYVAGFLITNIYLNTKYGIYDFSLVKARYIYAGVIFLLLCLMALFDSFVILKKINFEGKKTLQSKLGALLSIGFMYMTVSSISGLAVKGLLVAAEGGRIEAMREFPITFWFWLAIPLVTLHIWYLKRGGPRSIGIPLPFSSSVITSVIVLASLYSVLFYQFLPISLGGGMPSPVKIVVSEDSKNLVQQIVPFEDQNISSIVYLIDQSDRFYFLLVKDSKTNKAHPVEIDKSLVIGIVHPMDTAIPFTIKSNP
ncbi:MAG: hypothetical protein GXO35_07350 [Gammaproteobacteria bacterium]|nr:hypothetical protein [Gammaproteobacteria bacterium]